MSSMPFESPAEGEEVTETICKYMNAVERWHLKKDAWIQLTLKGVDILSSSLLKWNVQLLPPHTLNSEVRKAAKPGRKEYGKLTYLRKKYVVRRRNQRMWCVPVASVVVRINGDHADSRTVRRAVFTHKAVRMRPVWGVFCHQGNSDYDLFQVVNGSLNLTERTGQGKKEGCSMVKSQDT